MENGSLEKARKTAEDLAKAAILEKTGLVPKSISWAEEDRCHLLDLCFDIKHKPVLEKAERAVEDSLFNLGEAYLRN